MAGMIDKPLTLAILSTGLAVGVVPAIAAVPEFGPVTTSPAGLHAHAVRIADLNGDGKQDLVVANALDNTVSRLLGNGDGSFGAKADFATTSPEPKSIAIGDLNGDGNLDVVTANQNFPKGVLGPGSVTVLLGNGDGSFESGVGYSAVQGAHEAAIGDVDKDGKLDIVVVGWNEANVAVLKGNGAGGFAAPVKFPVGTAPHSVVIADFDGDGNLDLATANHIETTGTVSLLLGNGAGSFQTKQTPSVGSQPHSIRSGDLNGDHIPDLVTANDASNNVSVLIGQGDGTFATRVNYAAGTTPKSVFLADMNGDGHLDILTANIYGNYPTLKHTGGDTVAILLGNGDGTFQPKAEFIMGQGPFSVVAGDVNGDGLPDLATANWHDATASIRLLGNDLAVNLADTPDPVAAGGNLTYSAQVSNKGPFAASGVKLSITPAVGSSVQSSGGCGSSGSALVCNIGALPAGGTASRTITVSPAKAGGINALASVSAAQYDANPGDNQASAVTTVSGSTATPAPSSKPTPAPTAPPKGSPAPSASPTTHPSPAPTSTPTPTPTASPLPQPGPTLSADLSVSLRGPQKLKLHSAGAVARYVVTVRNKSGVAAALTSLRFEFPAGLQVLASPAGCAESAAGGLVCDLGTLPKHWYKRLSFKFRAGQPGEFTSAVTTSSAAASDPDDTNNSALKLTRVR